MNTTTQISEGTRVSTPHGPATVAKVNRTRAQVQYDEPRQARKTPRFPARLVSHETFRLDDLAVIA